MKLITFIIAIHFTYFCFANNSKVAQATRTIQPPKIDGLDDDECWKNCLAIEDFIQRLPLEGKPTNQKTQVFITYDDNAIYVLAKMYDEHPDSIFKLVFKP